MFEIDRLEAFDIDEELIFIWLNYYIWNEIKWNYVLISWPNLQRAIEAISSFFEKTLSNWSSTSKQQLMKVNS